MATDGSNIGVNLDLRHHLLPVLILWLCTIEFSTSQQCQTGIDIVSAEGVMIERTHGSKVELDISGGLHPSSSIEFEFRPETGSSSGLVLASGDDSWEDMAASFLHKGQLVFARQCGFGNVFEIYRKKIDDGKWHTLKFIHNERGGEVYIDGERPFRQYHMGPCKAFTNAYIGGGFSQAPAATRWARLHESFYGCIKNLKINERPPTTGLKYRLVSQCAS